MSDFLIVELDDRYEFGVGVIDDDVLGPNNSCNNPCCGPETDNTGCTNPGCSCPLCDCEPGS